SRKRFTRGRHKPNSIKSLSGWPLLAPPPLRRIRTGWDFRERQVTVSGHQSLLPFGHSSTENSCRGSVGQKSRTELECSRSVVLISKFRAFALLRARADSSCDGSKPEAFTTRPCGGPRTVAFSPWVETNDC